ncbi:MAG: DNA repair protein, partial [Candidatus Thiodiazotropha sp.]
IHALLRDHYLGEAQTLTSGAEENLLKLGELSGSLDAEQQARWEQIKADFARIQSMGGEDADAVTKIANQIALVSGGLGAIDKSIGQLFADQPFDPLQQALKSVLEQMREMELNVQVVNQPVPGMDKVLNVMGDAINVSLLPVVAAMEHKLKMDHDIWERVKLLAEQIEALEKVIAKKHTTKRRLSKTPPADKEKE